MFKNILNLGRSMKLPLIDLLLLTVPDRKCVGFSLILLCKNRFGFPSELAKSKKYNTTGQPFSGLFYPSCIKVTYFTNSCKFLLSRLLHIQLKRFKELLGHTKSENETTESVQNAVKWYEDLENTRLIIDILLAKWPRGTVCPPGVVKARADLKTFMDDSREVIMEDIKAYSNENISSFTVLRLHRACCLMSDLDGGQRMVSEYVEKLLLSRAEATFAAGGNYSNLTNIDRRFSEYDRQMRDYDKKFRPFIPKWWCLVCLVINDNIYCIHCMVLGDM